MRYADFSTNLTIHPNNGDLIKITDAAAIGNEIKNLILTNPYERFWNPTLGAGIPQTLFDNFGLDTKELIEIKVREVINNYVTRATLVDVRVVPNEIMNAYELTIVYKPENSFENSTINIILRRVR